MKTIKKISMLFIATFVLASCSNDDEAVPKEVPNPLSSIVEIAQNTPDLSTLVAAIKKTDLVAKLSNSGPFTVMAPTNDAFNKFLSDNGYNNLDEVPTEALKEILFNHIIRGSAINSDDLSGKTGYETTEANGPKTTKDKDTKLSLFYNGMSGVVFNNVSTVTTPDVEARNGIVHIVDAVIGLPTLATFATSNPVLSNLVDALVAADSQTPSPMLIPTLANANGNSLTVFTPTNDAFVALLAELPADSISDILPSTLQAVIEAHILTGNVTSDELIDDGEDEAVIYSTLNGEISINKETLVITDPNNRETSIVASLVNIQAINGVAHVIDRVILPTL